MIEISQLNKYYKVGNSKMHALKDINLTVNDGESLAIRGKSGAGKSTLMHIIGLLDNYDSGSLKIDGQEVKGLSDRKLAKIRNEKIGFVLQDFSLLDHKSVIMNTMLPLFFNNKYNFAKMNELALEALKCVGIEEQADKKVNQLSGGQRQRVAIARAIISNPQIILADEPTGALDSETSKEIMNLLMDLNKKNKITLIVITHDDAVADYCQKKVNIKDGCLFDI
ncbi:MAG: ABC transporter ATP-binding protein [Clostridia bacterium]|nr:ABC transporter ATP-binding protein [Clostridia bacterium]